MAQADQPVLKRRADLAIVTKTCNKTCFLPWTATHVLYTYIGTLTSARKASRVRVPPPICCTHCCHPLSWNKLWVTFEEYLSSLQCVLIWFNGTIYRRSGITTVDWRGKSKNSVKLSSVKRWDHYSWLKSRKWRGRSYLISATELSAYQLENL